MFPQAVLDHGCKRVYVMRNPKDVAVSLYHFHRSHQLLGFYKGTWDDFFECFISGQVIYGSWFEHTSEWLRGAAQDPGGMLMLHYEDLREDLATQIRRMSAFLHSTLSPQAVAAIAAHCSFQNMSADPFTNREGDPIMDFSIARFLRKGVVGDWKNYFTERQNERVDAEFERKVKSGHPPFAVEPGQSGVHNQEENNGQE
jgi:hypothetical protein